MKKALFYLLFFGLVACEGPTGPEGPQSLVDISDEPAGQNCSGGGVKISSGVDKNGNSTLDPDEISITKFVCEGSNGISSLLTSVDEPKGEYCANGGTKIEFGRDVNANGQLEDAEIDQTRYICNGTDGNDATGIKVVRIDALGGFGTAFPNNTTQPIIAAQIPNFNIDQFSDYDSIVYVSAVWVVDPQSLQHVTGPEIVFELVDRTNNDTTIPDSQVTSTTALTVVSKNLYKKIPSGYINIGMRAWSTDPLYGASGQMYLLLFDRY